MQNILPIAQLGDPIIRCIAEPVENINDEEIQALINKMMLTCEKFQGMGIAAPQVFQSKRLFIMSSKPNQRYPQAPIMEAIAVINPEIIWQSNEMHSDWEACLSVADKRGLVPRHTRISVSYFNQYNEKVETQYSDFLARLFQHEFDHLNGKVFTDKVCSRNDLMSEKEYQKIILENN